MCRARYRFLQFGVFPEVAVVSRPVPYEVRSACEYRISQEQGLFSSPRHLKPETLLRRIHTVVVLGIFTTSVVLDGVTPCGRYLRHAIESIFPTSSVELVEHKLLMRTCRGPLF